MKKKIAIFFVLAVFLMANASYSKTNEKIVTFSKYLPDGRIELFTETVECRNEEKLSEAIARKCKEMLMEEDYIKKRDIGAGLYFIISAGEGLHFSLPPSLLKSSFWEIIFSLFPSVVYCSYTGEASETDIISLMQAGDETLIYGEHRVLCIGFVGILGWEGIFSYSDTGFAGFSPFVWTSGG